MTVIAGEAAPWTADELVERLREQGSRYHIHHPFNVRMDAGELTREQMQRLGRQPLLLPARIPIKDAAILSNCPDREVRRAWVQRILDHDGTAHRRRAASSRGCASARRSACRARTLESERHVLPGVRFAVDAYVNFARRAPWQEAVRSSLTELFAPGDPQAAPCRAGREHYPGSTRRAWSTSAPGSSQARRDAQHGAGDHARRTSRRASSRSARSTALRFKLEMLWAHDRCDRRGDTQPEGAP